MTAFRYDFLEFLDGSIQIGEANQLFHICKIEIPSIQRDYAQGRLGENNELNQTGSRFIDTIFEFLTSNKAMFEMDFIYGSIELLENGDGYKFIPLDGQQRLTTLFLLYWFVGKIELDLENQVNLMKKLARFSYATRTSARRFCENLTKDSLEYNLGELPSDFLKKQKWFRQAQEDDPTVEAMLHMLDAISRKYSVLKHHNLWSRLSHMKFYVQPLEDFNLSEELYVKMNARGKPLTALENFKAELVRWMTKEGGEAFQKRDDDGYYFWFRIARKMDNDWLNNLFWKLLPTSEKQGADPAGSADILFYRFICRYVLMQYAIEKSNDTSFTKKPERDAIFAFLANEEDYRNLNPFSTLLSLSELEYIEIILDKLCSSYQDIIDSLTPSWGTTSDSNILFGEKIQQRERLIFFAATSYLRQSSPFNLAKYKQWMRVVWNIVQNTDVNDFSSMNGLLGLLNELSCSAESIYQDLPAIDPQSNAGRLALKEEKEKCSLIQRNLAWEAMFIDLEKHQFFKGSIGFVLDENIDIDVFLHRSTLLESLFNSKGIAEKYRDSRHLLIRGIISRHTTIESLNEKHFVEIDENEHYLKKMLAGDNVTRTAIRQLVSQPDVSQMDSLLISWINEPSHLPDAVPLGRYRFIHERLYKEEALQDWIQNENNKDRTRILKISMYANRYFINRSRSWYTWAIIDGFRNEIVADMLTRGYSLDQSYQQCIVEDRKYPFFYGARDEAVHLKKNSGGILLCVNIDRENVCLSVARPNQEEINIGMFEYQNNLTDKSQISGFIDRLEQSFTETTSEDTSQDPAR